MRLRHLVGPELLSHAGFHPGVLPKLRPGWLRIVEAKGAGALQAIFPGHATAAAV